MVRLVSLSALVQVYMDITLQVVGSQARILYSDQEGRQAIAVAFNEAVKRGELSVSRARRCYS